MKKLFFQVSIPLILLFLLLSYFWIGLLWLFVLIGPLFLIGVYDAIQRKHTVWRNFPLFGHLRFMFEAIRPEIQQYFIESDWSGRPLNRDQRKVVYARAKGQLDTIAFGTQLDVLEVGHEWLKHSMKAKENSGLPPRVIIGQGDQRYKASLLNISGMSFGAISKNAVLALNRGAKVGQFYHNTGEGGLSEYHLAPGGDIVFQIGTAYFGCRSENGQFSETRFAEVAARPQVKMIEIKLSQGAKPGGGGTLPGIKVTPEIAAARGIPVGKDVHSPPSHSVFSNAIEMMHYVQTLRELSGGKPVGIKMCVGHHHDFFALCKAMIETQIRLDFVTVDGAEGGTGAAAMSFANNVGTPLNEGLAFIHDALVGTNLREDIRIIASGKITSEFELLSKLALGADLANSARGMMLALGCIQSLRCNTNHCPTGVTTNDPRLTQGLVVEEKYMRVARFHKATLKALMRILGAAGLSLPSELTRDYIVRRSEAYKTLTYNEIYPCVEPGSLLHKKVPSHYTDAWKAANPN